MTENFCYNQIGINHILKQFGDAISNKQYKNPIPYDTYRKIKNGYQLIFISFDSGDVLVKNDSTTLFRTSYKDNGFGQFFYDNYVSTTEMVETKTNIKKNDTMKMPEIKEEPIKTDDKINDNMITTVTGINAENDYINVYYINEKNEKILYKKTEISTEYLSKEDVEKLEEGIDIYGIEELNKLLEDFE